MLLSDDLIHVSNLLNAGKVILYPTDSIWGLGCDPFNKAAVERVYEIKKRDRDKPFILLVQTIDELKKYIVDIHPRVESLLHYHNKPLTVIYRASQALPEYITSDKNTVAIRVINEPVISKLLGHFGKPLVSTSANIQGTPFPASFGDISQDIIEQADYVFQYKREATAPSEPSVLISFNNKGQLHFIRE